MKKFLFILLTSLSLTMSSKAQLPDGSIFPDFTLTDIKGNTYHLYAWLDSGYTVVIDVSATWCCPCWYYRSQHHLDSLYEEHGPKGMPNVKSSTTNDMLVLFVQGEPTSGLAELYGNTAGGAVLITPPCGGADNPYSTHTQGNWVAGSLYPIIDDSSKIYSYDVSWHIDGFPTIYEICRDRLVRSLNYGEANAEVLYGLKEADCPAFAPSTSIDAKVIPYAGSSYFICNGTPTVAFQNYSQADKITSATINVMDASKTVVATQPWTGSLSPYDIANINVTAFPGTSFGGYSFSVTVPGDSYAADNTSPDSIFSIYDASNSFSIPYLENFETFGNLYKYQAPDGFTGLDSYWDSSGYYAYVTVPGGGAGNILIFDNYNLGYYSYFNLISFDTTAFIFGNYNSQFAKADSLQFDEFYAWLTSYYSDTLDVLVSADCGDTWHTIWQAYESKLESVAAPTETTTYLPHVGLNEWKHVSLDISAYDNPNMMIQFVSHSSGNDYIAIDNIKLTAANEAVPKINSLSGEVNIYPNPAKSLATVSFTLSQNSNVTIQLYDELGNLVNTIHNNMDAGPQQLNIPLGKLAAGIYNVKVSTDNNSVYKKLSVMK